MKSDDALPNTLCKICEEKLKSFYEFRILCQKTDITLRELIQNEDKKCTKDIVVQPNDIFDEEDDLPLLQRSHSNDSSTITNLTSKRKRGRPKKSEANSYACKYCSKVLYTAKGLKTHLRVHTGEKMKHCLFCDAKYTRTNHLMRHIVTHDKPGVQHPCEHCEQMFESAADLFKHSKSHDEPQTEEVKVEQEEIIIDMPELVVPSEMGKTVDDLKIPINVEQTIYQKSNNLIESFQDTTECEDLSMDADGFGDKFDDSDDNNDVGFSNKDGEHSEAKKMRKEQDESSGSKDTFQCKMCLKVLSSPRGLKVHMRKHIGSSLCCQVNIFFFIKRLVVICYCFLAV